MLRIERKMLANINHVSFINSSYHLEGDDVSQEV